MLIPNVISKRASSKQNTKRPSLQGSVNNLFLTIAPAEWRFPRPYFLEPYLQCVFAGAYIMALHMYYLVRCVWRFLACSFEHRYFVVQEWVIRTDYQGRGTPHCHIAAWIICHGIMKVILVNKLYSAFSTNQTGVD